MKILSRIPNNPLVLCDCSFNKSIDIPVQQGLALRPRDVRRLTEQGIAVSTPAANEGSFTASDKPSDFSMDLMFERGVDRNVIWEKSQVAKQRIMNAKDKFSRSQRLKQKQDELDR